MGVSVDVLALLLAKLCELLCTGCEVLESAHRTWWALQELALRLLRKRAAQPEWWAAHAPHWQSLPPAGRVYAKESWRQEHLAPLQDPELVHSGGAVPACSAGSRAAKSGACKRICM